MIKVPFYQTTIMSSINSLLEFCPGWLKLLEELDAKLISDRALKHNTCNGLIIDKYGSHLSISVDLSWTSEKWWLKKSSEIKNTLYDRFQSLFKKTMLQIHFKCPKCGAYVNVYNINKQDLTYKINQLDFSESKIKYDLNVDDERINSCITCKKNYGREEFRLAVCSYGHLLNDDNVIKPFHFNEVLLRSHGSWFDHREVKKINIKKIVRFIDSQGHFKLINYGNYLFYDENLFIQKHFGWDLSEGIEDRISRQDRISRPSYLANLLYDNNISDFSILNSLDKVFYAGHFTGFIDDNAKPIYTGDIIRLKYGTYAVSRDPKFYLKKDRYVPEKGEGTGEVYGVVLDDITNPETYKILLDHYTVCLCHGTEMEVLGNIFFNLNPNERINLEKSAIDFYRSQRIETIREDLATIKTPSFISIT